METQKRILKTNVAYVEDTVLFDLNNTVFKGTMLVFIRRKFSDETDRFVVAENAVAADAVDTSTINALVFIVVLAIVFVLAPSISEKQLELCG